jgi:hypothetical protein
MPRMPTCRLDVNAALQLARVVEVCNGYNSVTSNPSVIEAKPSFGCIRRLRCEHDKINVLESRGLRVGAGVPNAGRGYGSIFQRNVERLLGLAARLNLPPIRHGRGQPSGA